MILVTGATGFLGRNLVNRLCTKELVNEKIRCFIRQKKQQDCFGGRSVEFAIGDINDEGALLKALENVDIVIHLAAIIKTSNDSDYYKVNFEATKKLVQRCHEKGVKKIIFVSSFQARDEFDTVYGRSKRLAEDAIRKADLEWIIIRPLMFYGESDNKDLMQLINLIKRCPIVPIFGDGRYKLQPLYVADLVDAIIRLVRQNSIKNITFEIGGGSVVTMNEFVDLACNCLNLKRIKIHLPLSLCRFILRIQATISAKPVINLGMFNYIAYDKICDNSFVQNRLNLYPLDAPSGIHRAIS